MNPAPVIPHDKLLDLLLDVVCVVNKEGRFLSVSAASERVFGYTPEELIGRTAFELIHPDDREATRQIVERITAGQPSSDHEAGSPFNARLQPDATANVVASILRLTPVP